MPLFKIRVDMDAILVEIIYKSRKNIPRRIVVNSRYELLTTRQFCGDILTPLLSDCQTTTTYSRLTITLKMSRRGKMGARIVGTWNVGWEIEFTTGFGLY